MISQEWKDVSLKLLEEPHNFTLWQSLVNAAENQNKSVVKSLDNSSFELLRKSYRAFLENFPLAVSYWISFARWENKLGDSKTSEATFLEGLSYAEHDLNLWVAYLHFKLETVTDNIPSLLALFEKARMKIGYHYHSIDFYTLYLSFLRTYSTSDNKFIEKSVLLLRLIMDIPLYSYAISYKEVMDFLGDSRTPIELLVHFAGETTLSELKTKHSNKRQPILEHLQTITQDAYVINQYQSMQLFKFEQALGNKCSVFDQKNSTMMQIDTWSMYLSFVEQNYSYRYVVQLYERCLVTNDNDFLLTNKYVNYLISQDKHETARNLLRRSISNTMGCNHTSLFLILLDLEIFLGDITLARDMIVRFIAHNPRVPESIFEKLIDLEILINEHDEIRVCTLVREVISITESSSMFQKLQTLSIPKSTLQSFFPQYFIASLPESSQ